MTRVRGYAYKSAGLIGQATLLLLDGLHFVIIGSDGFAILFLFGVDRSAAVRL